MPRLIKSPNSGSTIVNAVTPAQGGHGEVTAPDALEAMDLVPRNSIGKFGRPIPLDGDGYIDQRYLQDLYATMETVSGDLTIEVNQTKEYFLTGYDAFSVYDVRAVTGMVSVDRNVITYTAPGEPGQGGFTINGRMVAVTVTEVNVVEGIAPPVMLTPVRGTAGLIGPVSVTSSAFVTDNAETHVSTSWQCAEDPGFTVIVASVDQSTVHKTSWSIGTVMLGKHYFIRARYHGSGGGVSPWSEETHFTSPVPTPADRPVITSPVNGAARLPSRVTLTSSTYNTVTGDPHVSTSWEISESPLFTNLAFQNINSAVDKTSWMVSGLQPAKEYYARVRYRGQLHEYTEWSPTSAFRTRLAFLPETEIGKSGTYNGVSADMDDTGGRWIVGNGSFSTPGVNCAAYIYRREGGVPVLEDTIQAVAGQKNMVTTIPVGGQLEVTVNGRYTSTRSYTQAEEIIVPAGAQTLTLVGKGSSSNEVTASVIGNGSVQIPAGTTSLKLIGKGSDGTATSGISATMTIQGQTYTYPGGVGGPATPRTDNITLNGTAQTLSYSIPTGGSGQYGYPDSTGVSQSLAGTGEYIFPLGTPKVTITAKGGDGSPEVTGLSSTFTIQGITKTFPGGIGGPASASTQEITLDGTDLSMNYSIPATGSGVVQYSVSTIYSKSFTGNGSHNVPADVTTVSITGRGQDGTPTTTGANTVVTFNGQTYIYHGGVGGPATSRIDTVSVTAGSIKPLNHTVPQGGVVSLSYMTVATPDRETTATINGQTYTFSGSNSGAATNTTFTVDLVSNNNFGNGVAMNQDGTLAAICSSPKIGSTAGYVLVLQRSGTSWNIVDELNRVDGLVWHAQSVAMDKTGNYILVGADAQPVGASKIGSFAIYRRQAGKYAVEQTVIAPDPGVAYEAGSSVSLSSNASIAVIGAPAGGVASRTLVYERDNDNTLVLTATLSKTTDPHSADSFGTRVYISADGTTVAASSPTSRGVNTTHANCGEVIIFRKVDNVWTQVSTVRHPTPTTGLYFGQDLHLSDDGLILSVGVPGGTGGLGEVMFFDIEGSTVTYKSNVVSSAVTGGTNFGKAIALPGHSGDLVGASKFGTYVFD